MVKLYLSLLSLSMLLAQFSHFQHFAQTKLTEFMQKGDIMFKENFIKICAEKGVSPTSVCVSIGLSSSVFSQWSDSTVPRKTTLVKLADALNVSVDYLLGKEEKPAASGELSEGEKKLIDAFRDVSEDLKEQALRVALASLQALQ